MEHEINLTELLPYIRVSELSYQEWVNVGTALKQEGYPVRVWDDWSRSDSRYHPGECEKKWNTFQGTDIPVTGGTIVQMAKERGWVPDYGHELDWNDTIGCHGDDLVVVNNDWLEGKELSAPCERWNPAGQLIRYLETLFELGETVGYVVESYQKDQKYLPANKGCYDRSAGKLIEELSKCGGDIGSVLGDYNPEAGAWIRFNPLDGNGVKNENVTEYRYALVESDSADLEQQNAIMRELELPIACLVYSGGKSIHAIVKIEAANYEEYRKRVDYLYLVCRKNGLDIDTQNRNPSRLSRMPGVMRNGKQQYILDTNIGKQSWNEWKEWIESVNDDLPEPESMESVWNNLPELSPPLIENVLRQGHKMLIAGPSKAGKSFALIELCCSIAEGKPWFGFDCAQGRVLYVNLELDRASCLHRFKDVYTALGWEPKCLRNIDIWNLRGKSVPMDKLAPKLIRRAAKKNYIAIIIDPIYKVITGDENSADQMANFCNQFDKVCTELGCAVIYCHHHSKGAQGGKRSMDRASGSGVFARDPDALLDLIELNVNDDLKKQQQNNAVCRALGDCLERWNLLDEVSQDDLCSSAQMRSACRRLLDNKGYQSAMAKATEAEQSVEQCTAWRIEGTLREYPKFPALNLWFDFPIHRIDRSGVLQDVDADMGFTSKGSPYHKNFGKKKANEERKEDRRNSLITAFESCNFEDGSEIPLTDLCEYTGTSERTVRRWISEFKSDFYIVDNNVGRRNRSDKVD